MRALYLGLVLVGIPLLTKAQENIPTLKPMVNDTANVTEMVSTKETDEYKDNSVALAPDSFVQKMLSLVNKYRMMHAALPLSISQELTQKAATKAAEMAALDKEQIDVNSKYGQAIFSTSNPNNVAIKSVQSWYNQMRSYDFHRAIPSAKAMYFTQMVWVDTKEFGAGKAVASGGKIYVVALFNPSGNKGPFENEVRPVTGSGVGKLGDSTCTEEYKFFNNSCFKFFLGLRNWNQAAEKCSSEFATLASVESIDEDNFIKTLLSEAGANDAWIGMSDIIKEGFVTWLDGSAPHFLDWDQFQSTVEGPKCITINTQTRWRYQRCDIPRGFVCRKRLRDIGTYEVTMRFLDKVWSDALLNPSAPRYLALRHHLEGAVLDVYGDFDWFDKFTFDSFRKDKQNQILADFKLEFAPDDNSPTDPLDKLREALKASSQGQGGQKKSVIERHRRETVSGTLHGLRVELVNVSLVLDESLTCPSYCQATQCAPSACSQQCCGQYGQQAAAGGYGGQGLGQQYGYSYGNQLPLGQQPLQLFPMPSFTNIQCRRPPCPPQFPSLAAPCQRPPCPPQMPSLAAPCQRPPCPPPMPSLAAPCQRPPCPPPMPSLAAPCQNPPCPPPMQSLAASCQNPPCPPSMPSLAAPCQNPPCPPPMPSLAAPCQNPPCPPPMPSLAAPCQRPPCPPPMPSLAAPCQNPPCPPPMPSLGAPCQNPPCPPPMPSLAGPCQNPPCPPPMPSLAAPCQNPPCPPQLPSLPAPCQRPPCPPQTPRLPVPLPFPTGTCNQPPCPPQPPLFQSSPLPCPQPPCPPPFPNSATSCSQPPCPPPASPQFPSLPCSTPPCLPNQGLQYNSQNPMTTQPFGRVRQLPSLSLPARRHRLKEKIGKGKKGSDAAQANQSPPKPLQQPAPPTQELNYKDIFLPSSSDPYNQQSGYMVRLFKPVIEIQRPAPPVYGYGNGYQNYQYMYPQAQQYQPYSSYQPYQRYPSSQPYPNYQYGQPYQTFAPQGNIPAVSRATTATAGRTASETKPDKQRHHRFHHRRRMPLTSYYPPSFQNQYYSNPYSFQGQLLGMYPPRQQYGSYMNYPPPFQFQLQPQFTYRYSAQPQYPSQYQAPFQAPFTPQKPLEVRGSPGLGYLELPSQARVCAAPCPNSCSPECTPDCCRDKKKKRQLIAKP